MDQSKEIEKIKLLKQLTTGLLEFESMWNRAVSTLEERDAIHLDKAA